MKNINYWSNFYENNSAISSPSNFCLTIDKWINDKKVSTILDCGCGNGRDSYHFGERFIVTGIDSSGVLPQNNESCTFFESDFCNYNKDEFDLIYSRFTMHSITNENHEVFLKSITKSGTYLCMEFRSELDRDTEKEHGKDHYRNYISKNYIKNLLPSTNFEIMYIEQDYGFALYKKEDPNCIRIIARKK